MIVVDASAVLEVLLVTAKGQSLEPRLLGLRETLHAPHLIDLEVAQVLRRYTAAGQLEAARAEDALGDFRDFPIARYPHEPLLSRIWTLRDNLSAYDAPYVSLAEALEAVLVTCDDRLARAPGHSAHIEVV